MATPRFSLAFVRITRVDDLFLDENDLKASPFRSQVLVAFPESDASAFSSSSSCSSATSGSSSDAKDLSKSKSGGGDGVVKWQHELSQVAQNVLLMAFATNESSGCGSGYGCGYGYGYGNGYAGAARSHQLVHETSWFEFFQPREGSERDNEQHDNEEEEEDEEEEIFNREVDPIGFRDLPMGWTRAQRTTRATSEVAKDQYDSHNLCFFQLPNDPTKSYRFKGIACVDPRTSTTWNSATTANHVTTTTASALNGCFQVVVLLSNVPFQMFLKEKFVTACREMFLQDDLFTDEDQEQEQRVVILNKLYRQLMTMDFGTLPYREIFVGLPLVTLAKRFGKDLMGILRLILLGGRIVCFASDISMASSLTMSLLAFLPGSLAIHSEFSSRPLQVALYRLKRFGLPFSLFDEDFLFQPCFTLSEQDPLFTRSGGFLLGTNDSLLLRHPKANLDAIVDLENYHVIAFPTPKAQASFTLGAHTAAFGDSLAQKFGRGFNPASSLEDPTLSAATDAKIVSPFSTSTGRGASMEENHSEIDWLLAQFQSYFEHFVEQTSEYLDSIHTSSNLMDSPDPNATGEDSSSSSSSASSMGIMSRLEEMTAPFLGESSGFLNEFGRHWFVQWQKTNIYDRWQTATRVERRRTTCVTMTPPPREGHGRFTYPNGDEYEGNFCDGKRHGFGVYVEFVTKNQYEGDWANDERHGKGILSSKMQGYIYDGEWSHNIRQGFGNSTVKNVESYSGYWRGNRFHGSGVYSNLDGEVYDGEWNMGVREGVGKLTICKMHGAKHQESPLQMGGDSATVSSSSSSSGNDACSRQSMQTINQQEAEEYGGVKEYMGEWKNNKFNGTGKLVYADGSHYCGEFQDGKRHGNGFFGFANGDTYDGQWWKGYFHGEGSFASSTSGITKEGTWRKNDEVDGLWFITYKNGDKYNGQSRRGRPWGTGVCKYANGSSYNGEWVDGLRHGTGVFINADGTILEGEWRSGLLVHESSQTASGHSRFVVIPLSPSSSSSSSTTTSSSMTQHRNKRAMTAPESPLQSPAMLAQCTGGFSASFASLRRLSGIGGGGEKTGQCVALPPDRGIHVFVYSNGDVYEGEYKNGMRDGHGTLMDRATGNLYEGNWKADRRHGTGILTSGTKDFIYDGEWVNDWREGQGYCVIRDCESYAGAWVRSQFHGIGKYIDAEGNVYEGEFRGGKKHGIGEQLLHAPRKETYKGEWKDGQRHGVGDATFDDGSRYSGSWKHDLQEGEGTWTWPNGDQYSGQWRQGLKDGMGIWSSSSGIIKEGVWMRDTMVDGEWSIQFPDKSKYTGQCVRGKPHGRGVCKYANGDLYDGQWVHGKRHGFGCGFFANGESFEGEWENNHVALNGKGKLTMADGTMHVYNR